MAVRIVTDSTADIPLERAQALGIIVVPLTVFFGDEAYLDGVELDNPDFYRKLQASKVSPRTSQPPPDSFQEAFTRLIKEGADAILSVHLSAKLSGTYQSACTGRDSLPEELKKIPIDIVDSQSVSLGMSAAIMRAAEEARQGLGLEEIKAHLLDQISRSHILFALDTLEEVIIVESDDEVGQQLARVLRTTYQGAISSYKLGAVIGTYTGPNTAGVVVITAK